MRKSRLFMSAAAACLAGTMAVTGFAATEHWNDNSGKKAISDEWSQWKTEWETIKTDYEKVSMTPGADATKMNYAWYSKTADEAKVRISETPDMTKTTEVDGNNTYAENYKEFTGTSKEYKKIDDVLYYANKVTITDLKENTTYYYQCLIDGKWSNVKKFKTGDTSDFSFLYVGDPQIGASKGQKPAEASEAQSAAIAARNDAFSWNKTLTAAISEHSDVDFIVSAGDQINNTGDDNGQECEYAGFLSADVLGNVPVAPTIGNHDSKFANYQNHFNVPNPYTEEKDATPAGNDYYYTYGDALFIVLNTNNYNCADHEALIKKAEAEVPNAKWKIVTFHHDIYGSGYDHSDSDGMVLRTQLTTLFDKYDIDVVLQGHDHTYSRSYMLTSDSKTHTAYTKDNVKEEYLNVKDGKTEDSAALESKQEYLDQNLCYKIVDIKQNTINNPEGVLYMEANSATGSKYYNLISTQQDYIAARSQTWTPTYSVVNVTKDTFSINTYDVNTGEKIDDTFTITKKEETGNNETSNNEEANKEDETNKNTTVKSIKLNKTKVSLKKGEKVTLKPTVSPSGVKNKKVQFTSSDKKVATVSSKGVVTAKKAGKATITVKVGTKKAICKIVVK